MKRKAILKLISILMVISMLFAFSSSSALAAEPLKEVTLDMVTDYAEKWVKEMYESDEVCVDVITPLKNFNDSTVGYHITFIEKSAPCGYIVLRTDGTLSDPLAEYSLQGNGIVESIDFLTNNEYLDEAYSQETIYSPYPFEYFLGKCDNRGSEKIIYDGLIYDFEPFVKQIEDEIASTIEYFKDKNRTSTSNNIYDKVMDFHDAPGIIAETKIIDDAVDYNPARMSSFSDGSNIGNCVPTAATNILIFFDECRSGNSTLIPNSRQTAYDRIVEIIGKETNVVHKKGVDAAVTYAKERGYLLDYNNYWFDWWSDFKNDINNNKPIFVDVQGVDNSGENAGHSMVCVGYVVRSVNGEKTNYLRVASGWEADFDRVCQFKGWRDIDGYSFTIKRVN